MKIISAPPAGEFLRFSLFSFLFSPAWVDEETDDEEEVPAPPPSLPHAGSTSASMPYAVWAAKGGAPAS
jgi:hypothetical protein